jgi:8-oxo-dGTP diphosphatase
MENFTSLYDRSERLLKGIDSENDSIQVRKKIKAAVAVVFKGSSVLLGKCLLKDDRLNKWCFPGGGIKSKETPYQAAVRECFEEMGIKVKARDRAPIVDDDLDDVIFILCDYVSGEITPNFEFSEGKWYSLNELPKDMYSQNRKLLNSVK